MFSAYLCVTLNTRGPIPVVTSARIYSEPAKHLTKLRGDETYAEIYSTQGSSFQEAKDLVGRYAEEFAPWVLPFLDGFVRIPHA